MKFAKKGSILPIGGRMPHHIPNSRQNKDQILSNYPCLSVLCHRKTPSGLEGDVQDGFTLISCGLKFGELQLRQLKNYFRVLIHAERILILLHNANFEQTIRNDHCGDDGILEE